MKILFKYIRPFRKLVIIAFILAAINQTFSMFDPMLFGRLIDEFAKNPFLGTLGHIRTQPEFLKGIGKILLLLVGTAMISRIAKAFQDYTVNVIIQKFGAALFTDGLRHSMQLPFQAFEDQRSGETLSILTKARADCEKFISYVINVIFGIIVSIVFISIYATKLHWSIMPIYIIGAGTIAYVTNLLSKRIKSIQKNIFTMGQKSVLFFSGRDFMSLQAKNNIFKKMIKKRVPCPGGDSLFHVTLIPLYSYTSLRVFPGPQICHLRWF